MKKGYVDTAEGQMHYWTSGAGPKLVTVHQSSSSADEYLQLAELLKEDVQVVSVDLQGHGLSYDPKTAPVVEEYSGALQAFLDALELSDINLLGHHGGAAVCLHLAATCPERVAKLVLSGTGLRSPDEANALTKRPMVRDMPLDEAGDFLMATWDRMRSMAVPGTDLQTVLRIVIGNLQSRQRPFDPHHTIPLWDKATVLDQISCPTLLIQGDQDIFCKRQDELQRLIPGSQRTVVPGGGAYLMYEKPEEVAEIVRSFLFDA